MSARYHYDEFGIPLDRKKFDINWPGPDNLNGYTGLEYDYYTDLTYARARYYKAEIGRFISEDAYKGDLWNPQSQNLYVYVANNPLKYVDPSGNDYREVLIWGRTGKHTYNSDIEFYIANFGDIAGYLSFGRDIDVVMNSDDYKTEEVIDSITNLTMNFLGGVAGAGSKLSKLTKTNKILSKAEDIKVPATKKSKSNYYNNYFDKNIITTNKISEVIGNAVKVNSETVINSATAPKKGGETVVGHALQKHAGRNPDIWGKVKGGPDQINQTALKHLEEILDAPGDFIKVTNDRGITFLEKKLPDGRGVRLNLDGTFKGFIDQ
jgi:RHS repeat-associated protein